MRVVGVRTGNRVTKLQRKLPFSTYFSIQIFRIGWLKSALLFSSLCMPSAVWSQSSFEPPFWPAFPDTMPVIPTHVTFQTQASAANAGSDPFQSDIKVIGEGRGFLVLVSSVDHVVFATVPRMDLAWKVACGGQDCTLSSASGTTEDQRLAPAYQAALEFASSRATQLPGLKKRQEANSILPPLSILIGSGKRGFSTKIPSAPTPNLGIGEGLLQGFK